MSTLKMELDLCYYVMNVVLAFTNYSTGLLVNLESLGKLFYVEINCNLKLEAVLTLVMHFVVTSEICCRWQCRLEHLQKAVEFTLSNFKLA